MFLVAKLIARYKCGDSPVARNQNLCLSRIETHLPHGQFDSELGLPTRTWS